MEKVVEVVEVVEVVLAPKPFYQVYDGNKLVELYRMLSWRSFQDLR